MQDEANVVNICVNCIIFMRITFGSHKRISQIACGVWIGLSYCTLEKRAVSTKYVACEWFNL